MRRKDKPRKPDRVDMAIFNALDSKRSRGAERPTPTEEAERIAREAARGRK